MFNSNYRERQLNLPLLILCWLIFLLPGDCATPTEVAYTRHQKTAPAHGAHMQATFEKEMLRWFPRKTKQVVVCLCAKSAKISDLRETPGWRGNNVRPLPEGKGKAQRVNLPILPPAQRPSQPQPPNRSASLQEIYNQAAGSSMIHGARCSTNVHVLRNI